MGVEGGHMYGGHYASRSGKRDICEVGIMLVGTG